MAELPPTDRWLIGEVLGHYSGLHDRDSTITLVKPGLSGARVWRIDREGVKPICLRRWPAEHPSAERLTYIHAVLSHLAAGEISFTPRPLPTSQGTTFVRRDSAFWEVTNWLPGNADFRAKPSPERLAAAMRALAELHIRAVTFADATSRAAIGVSPGIVERAVLLQKFVSGRIGGVERAISAIDWPGWAERAREILKCFRLHANQLERDLGAAGQSSVPLQPCIRDIHDEHMLFDGDVVSGIIDFGAMRHDNVATDVATDH